MTGANWRRPRNSQGLSPTNGVDGSGVSCRSGGAPPAGRAVVEEIVGITDSVCQALLDEEYADLARRAAAKLARKRPSPIVSGRRGTWAAGLVYALGQVNFLSDPDSETPGSYRWTFRRRRMSEGSSRIYRRSARMETWSDS